MTHARTNTDWMPIKSAPTNIEVWTAIIDANGIRNKQKMTFHSNLWWSGGMYVYYEPTHWRPA